MTTQAVLEKIATLPTKPGCYLRKDKNGTIIYVGKAINLRSRVRSYFQKSANHTPKVRRLVSHIADLDYIVCATELEAQLFPHPSIKFPKNRNASLLFHIGYNKNNRVAA